MNKLHVGIIFGGRSGEHEVSLRSARAVADAIDRNRYRVTLIGISRSGHWRLLSDEQFRQITDRPLASIGDEGREIFLLPSGTKGQMLDAREPQEHLGTLDVVLPLLHGPCGEDGTVQGFLELANVPYVGAGVLGSAVGMDKDVQKRLLHEAGLPITPFFALTTTRWATHAVVVREQATALGFPLFIKPANMGSSVGVSKVHDLSELDAAISLAFRFDTKALVEKGIDAREIECAVLGNDDPQVSVPGEVRSRSEFYSYEAKYIDENGAELLIPAPISEAQAAEVRRLAAAAFTTLECAGLARIDLFLERRSGRFLINEINTIPGFTSISMYPKLWEASGCSFAQLIDRLIALAMERHTRRRSLQTTLPE